MRDPTRLDRMIERLRELWHAQPDMRLGQLLVNVIRPGEPCPRIFYAEDTDTETKLAKYPEPVADRTTGSGISLELTRSEALVLFEFVNRFTDTEQLTIEHPAETRVLWSVCGLLEKQLVELFDPARVELVAQARATVQPDTSEELP
ncbi:hypothetical protein [Frigoriglobus tundricola]|uniref:Uncharacterized protein n=1 Tax=Frigoriglobus tundricola TaxID=2774151 RepID=A0A6M5YSA9_9BACT|nr:hypothetical protein [Frigoriglobus tundricola]QJW96151.1 hypothetical protein FTUN_3707 [Frigoriglobus tundricola]